MRMTLNEYQDAARKTCLNFTLEHLTFGLVEETGEVAGVMKRLWRKDPGYLWNSINDETPIISHMGIDNIKAELGDVLWYLTMLADTLEVRLEDVAAANLSKLKDRQSRGVLTGSGDNR